jgi:hypothetical protein
MNEAQDVLIKTGAKLKVNEAADVKNVQLNHNGTNANLITSAGDFIVNAFTGIVSILKAGTNSFLRIFGNGGVNYTEINNDDTDGNIITQAGNLNLNPAGIVYAIKDFLMKSGKKFYAYDAGNTKSVSIYHNGTDGHIDINSGSIYMNMAGGILRLKQAGVDNILRIYEAAGTKNVEIKHDGTNGAINIGGGGDLVLSPATNVNFNHKNITNPDNITYGVAQTRYININPADFVPAVDNIGYIISVSPVMLYNHAIGGNVVGFLGLHLPDGAVVTYLEVFWYRDDAAAAGYANLVRNSRYGVTGTMATADSNSTGGNHSVLTSAITNPTIDNTNYSYDLYLSLISNDSVSDVGFFCAIITYTITKPLP